MEHGRGDKCVAGHHAHFSFLVWILCFVRDFMSAPDKLNTDSSLSISAQAAQDDIGHAIGDLLCVALMFFGATSLVGAFISGCPFRSVFSGVIRLIFEILQTLSKQIHYHSSKSLRWVRIITLTVLWIASSAAVAYATFISGN